MPQFEQKRAPGAASAPHSGQREATGLPQFAQNFASGWFAKPQCGQARIVDIAAPIIRRAVADFSPIRDAAVTRGP
jgi:hypothetical protein